MTAQTMATTTSAVSSRVDWAPVPKVNLLPPEILEGRQFARRQKVLAVAVVATIATAGAVTYLAQGQVDSAQEELSLEQARTGTLQAEKAKYDEVPRVLAQVDAAKVARQAAMATDVPWYRFMNDLALSTPRSVWLQNLTVTIPAATGTAVASNDPLAPLGVGNVTVMGTASDYPTVASWLDGLDHVEGVDGTAISEASGNNDKPNIDFNSSGSITPDALSHRYDRKAD